MDVKSPLLFEGRPCSGETDAEIVAGAWDFASVQRAYTRHAEIPDRRPRGPIDTERAARSFVETEVDHVVVLHHVGL